MILEISPCEVGKLEQEIKEIIAGIVGRSQSVGLDMAQWIKAVAPKLDDLNLITRVPMAENGSTSTSCLPISLYTHM